MECLSAAGPSGLEGRFYGGHVREIDGSSLVVTSLGKMLHNNYFC